MPVPDFSPGEVLTAAAMDSIGLWLVKTQTVGTGVTSVTVTDAFSADYDNYRIVVSNVVGTSVDWLLMTLSGASGLSYGYGSNYILYGGGTAVATSGGQAYWQIGIIANKFQLIADITQPFLATNTMITYQNSSNVYENKGGGYNSNNTSSTGFTFTAASGTLTGGTIRVYGYRN